MRVPPTKLGIALFVRNIEPHEIYIPLGLSKSYFSQLLWGKRKSREVCEQVAALLEISVEELYEKDK